jgi:hypothetical protein
MPSFSEVSFAEVSVAGGNDSPPTANLALWLSADTGVTLSGSNVTAWADQSGNGNNATATGTPTLSTVSSNTFMNFAGGYFTGSQLLTQPQATIMCVARFSSLRDVEMIFQQTTGSGDGFLMYRGFNLGNGFRFFNGLNVGSSLSTNNNQTYLFGATNNGTSATLFLNASQDTTANCGSSTPSGTYYLGRWVGNSLTTTEMQMAELIIYNTNLGTSDRQLVENYLNTKYAIY